MIDDSLHQAKSNDSSTALFLLQSLETLARPLLTWLATV